MKNPAPGRGLRGFSLIELLVVMALMLIVAALGIPTLITAMHQAKVFGVAQEMKTMMAQGRLEAIKTARAILQIVPSTGPGDIAHVQLFVDADGDGKLSGSETVTGSLYLPNGISFEDKDENLDKDSVTGLSADPDGGPNVAIFQRDGTVDKFGAFHVADPYGNFLEVRVSLTGKVELRKWNGTAYVLKGDNGEAWTWN
jgi:prepilin-type N-terminal cleavage/methylation domain-containing protein